MTLGPGGRSGSVGGGVEIDPRSIHDRPMVDAGSTGDRSIVDSKSIHDRLEVVDPRSIQDPLESPGHPRTDLEPMLDTGSHLLCYLGFRAATIPIS